MWNWIVLNAKICISISKDIEVQEQKECENSEQCYCSIENEPWNCNAFDIKTVSST